MQGAFLKHAFFDAEDYENENDPFASFFHSGGFSDFGHRNNFNHSHGHPFFDKDFDPFMRDEFFGRRRQGGEGESNRGFGEDNYNFSRGDQHNHYTPHPHYDNNRAEPNIQDTNNIKYNDNKIYDV